MEPLPTNCIGFLLLAKVCAIRATFLVVVNVLFFPDLTDWEAF